jgi:hypothetical protein
LPMIVAPRLGVMPSFGMEDWLAAGSLSEEEFDQLVRLTARYFYWDVDQFDHWLMSSGSNEFFYVDFSDETLYPENAYRPMWPVAEPGERAWTVWRQDDNGNQVEMSRYANPGAAAAVVAAYERRGHKQLYWVVGPPA